MARPLEKLTGTYANGDAWTPSDFNTITSASRYFTDVIVAKHDDDYLHQRDQLIPFAIAIYSYGGAYASVKTYGGLTLDANPAVGRVRMILSTPVAVFTDYAWTVDPFPVGTEVIFPFDNAQAGAINDDDQFEFRMVNNVGNYVDRGFLVQVFGRR